MDHIKEGPGGGPQSADPGHKVVAFAKKPVDHSQGKKRKHARRYYNGVPEPRYLVQLSESRWLTVLPDLTVGILFTGDLATPTAFAAAVKRETGVCFTHRFPPRMPLTWRALIEVCIRDSHVYLQTKTLSARSH